MGSSHAKVLRPFQTPKRIPKALEDLSQWICWRERWNPHKSKVDKVPAIVANGHATGYLKQDGQSTYTEAVAAIGRLHVDGIGFALMDGEIIGGDLDNCRDPATGVIEAWAQRLIDRLETYCEVTPSGKGIRFFAFGALPGGVRSITYQAAQVELYVGGRFLTFTGDHLAGTPMEIHPAPQMVEALVDRMAAMKALDGVADAPAASKQPLTLAQYVYQQSPYGQVNQAALKRLDEWVPELFPTAEHQPGTGAWRIKSADLGRPDLQEDLSISPRGGKDFGLHDMGDPRGGKRSPVDIVMIHHPLLSTKEEAVEWLAETLNIPFGDAAADAPPASDDPERKDLTLEAWIKREIPPRQFLMGALLCTTSRWLVFGETGVGKSMLMYAVAAACSAGAGLLNWKGSGKPARTMIIDGEMPIETFKERMALIASRYGSKLQLYGYNREALGDGQMPPLNDEQGQRWLLAEIEAVKPDIIIFDSIMCLLDGAMSEEESWEPVKRLVRQITAKRIAQIWLHHTGHDGSKGFGTKTREWEMDTVVRLAFTSDERDAVAMEFRKARLRTPDNAAEFEAMTIELTDAGWTASALRGAPQGRQSTDQARLVKAIIAAYDRMQSEVEDVNGPDGYTVRKVKVEKLREEVKSKGWLEQNDKGQVTPPARKAFQRAKQEMVADGRWKEDDGWFWRDRPSTFPGKEEEVY